MKSLKDQKGITLIALIITIIILVILAGVTLSNLFNSGLYNKTNDANMKIIIEEEKEQIALAVMSLGIDRHTEKGIKAKQNENSGFYIETPTGDREISIYANKMARELNAQAKTLTNTLKLSKTEVRIASTEPTEIAPTGGVYQLNKNGILVWDYDRRNDVDYELVSDWVKVRFENRQFNHTYVVNKWTGEIIEIEHLYEADFPLTEPGTYYFTVDAGAPAKWLYMKKFDEVIPAGAGINYTIFVSDDKANWQEYPSIAEIDRYTQYIRIFIELVPNKEGDCPSLAGLVVKFKHFSDLGEEEIPEDVGIIIPEETINVIPVANGYAPSDPTQPATVTQKMKLSTPMTPEQIRENIDTPIEDAIVEISGGGRPSVSVYVSLDGNTWIPIDSATPGTEYPYVKTVAIIPPYTATGGGSTGGSTGGSSGQSGSSTSTDTGTPSRPASGGVGTISVKPKEEKPEKVEMESWKTVETKYYYAISDGPAEWIKINVDETVPDGTRIRYTSSKSSDGDYWTGYSSDITANNDSDYVKVKVEFQTKDAKIRPTLNEIEIVCNFNGKQVTHKATQNKEWEFTVASQNQSLGSVSGNSGKYKYNTPITVTATPANGYKLVGWSDGTNIVSTSTTYTFNMPKKDYTLTAIWISNVANLGEVLVYDEHTTFVVVTDKKTWKTAQSYAASYGGRLAVIDCKEKQDLIYSRVRSIGDAWIGLTDEAQEGVWVYVDGRSASIYSNWNGGEPNNSGGEDYAEMYMSSGKWNDLNGSQSYPFIIEFNT